MKKLSAFFIFLLLTGTHLNAQDSKFIEVTGSAEMLIEPDAFIFIIGIEEYWKEEFEKKKEFEDYKNKVNISTIESQLVTDLIGLGIKNENIKSTEIGNFYRYRSKEFLISKRIEISLNDFKMINPIISKLDRKGIEYMQIGELKNKDLVNYRKEVKKQALLAAKEKAAYLLEAIDKKLGDVISITEINSENYFWRPTSLSSNTIMNTSENPEAENEKKIKLRFEINARFEIQ